MQGGVKTATRLMTHRSGTMIGFVVLNSTRVFIGSTSLNGGLSTMDHVGGTIGVFLLHGKPSMQDGQATRREVLDHGRNGLPT